MKKLLWLCIVFCALVGCQFDGEDDDCLIPDTIAQMSVSFENVEMYETPKTGLSCQEFKKRNTYRFDDYGNSSCGEVESLAMNDVADSHHSGDQYSQNTIVSGITEGRYLTFNANYIISTFDNSLKIYNRETKELIHTETSITSVKKVLTFGDKLIVDSHDKILVYSLHTNTWFEQLATFDVQNAEIKIKDDIAYITETHRSLNDNINCEEIIYFDDSKHGNLIVSSELNLDSLIISNKTVMYGRFKDHLDQNAHYFYKENYNYQGIESILVKKVGGSLLSTSIDGRIPNEFSIKEYGNTLLSFVQKQNSSSLVSFNEKLEVISTIDDLGVGEQIYSARFESDQAFLVTFRQIDPLFLFDVSNPKNPVLLDELKIPGVSHYLESLSEQYLLGVGQLFNNNSRWDSSTLELSLFRVMEDDSITKVDSVVEENFYMGDIYSNHQRIESYNEFVFIKAPRKLLVLLHSEDRLVEYFNQDMASRDYDLMIDSDELLIIDYSGIEVINLYDDGPVEQD